MKKKPTKQREELRVDAELLRQADEQMRRRRTGDAPAEHAPDEFNPTFAGSRHERAWILGALGPFYQQQLIGDVVRSIKGGKEASVYLCTPAGALAQICDDDYVAAKVYRPREFRNLSNDALYRAGREVYDGSGKAVRDSRRARALAKKTRYGKNLSITSWIRFEYETLRTLHTAGADIPRPYAQQGNAILMQYVGDGQGAAPALQRVRLEQAEAEPLFQRIMHNVGLMLAHDRVHGDLSAYNILYWHGEACLIDFPQAVDTQTNDAALDLLIRDVERICQYFGRYGIQVDPNALAVDLWVHHQFPVAENPPPPSEQIPRQAAGLVMETITHNG